MIKKIVAFIILISTSFVVGWHLDRANNCLFCQQTIRRRQSKEFLLIKYSYLALRRQNFSASKIKIEPMINNQEQEQAKFTSQLFYFWVEEKRVSGLINLPFARGRYPVVILIRGYVDREQYQTGIGTKRIGEFLASAGFITLAPDFLGYGQSDWPANQPLEERFQTYTTILTLLASLNNLADAISNRQIQADVGRVGIWGHSNGGQIALSVLEITGKNYPTVLWAPVSKPFPYSILYYTDSFEDKGKALRRIVADFEKDYNVEFYSLTNYFDWIAAPIQLHQGIVDEAVPKSWSDELATALQKKNKLVEYFVYDSADHNLMPSGWSLAASRTADFFRRQLTVIKSD